MATVLLPSSTFAEKSGSFENADAVVQHFNQAIPGQHASKSEGQIAMDLVEMSAGGTLTRHPPSFGAQIVDAQPGQVAGASESVNIERGELYDPATIRTETAQSESLASYVSSIKFAPEEELVESDMELVTL